MGTHRRVRLATLLAASIALVALLLLRTPERTAAAAATPATLTDPDAACAGCHRTIYQSYEQTSMARGSGLAAEALRPGSFTSPASGVTYRVGLHNGTPTLRSQRDDPRAPLDNTEALAYFIGSGLHGRTYLFRRDLPGTGSALWYEAPVNWYTRRAAYGMAPAFDRATTAPLSLPTEPNCLHCHSTGVATPVQDTGNRYHGTPFRQGGIGCSACHGDTAAHLASGGKTPVLRLAALSPKRQDSVCLQCHLEGDALVQRAGKSLAQFTPGDDLDATAVYFVNANSAKTAARASSQYEALLRSACRRAVGERLTCVTCHDPHSEPAPAERVAYFRGKCLQCHADSATFHVATHHPEQPDCASCHMPSRTTSDIAHEQNVDHDIEVRHAAVTPKPLLTDAFHFANAVDLQPVGTATPGDRELGLAYAQFAAQGDRASHARALTLLAEAENQGHADAVVHQQLGYMHQIAGHTAAARQEYEAALQQEPHDTTSAANLAVIAAQTGDMARATQLLQLVSATAPDRTAALLNLAMLQCRANSADAARNTLHRALFYQPDSMDVRHFLETGDYAGMHCKVF